MYFLRHFIVSGQIVTVANSHGLKNNIAIWLHCTGQQLTPLNNRFDAHTFALWHESGPLPVGSAGHRVGSRQLVPERAQERRLTLIF